MKINNGNLKDVFKNYSSSFDASHQDTINKFKSLRNSFGKSGCIDIDSIGKNDFSNGHFGAIDVENHVNTSEIKSYVNSVKDDFDSVVVIGYGGSSLGTKAILEALRGRYYNENYGNQGLNIYFTDNIDGYTIGDMLSSIDVTRTLFLVISKSGSTLEVLAQYIFFRDICKKQNSKWENQFCFIVGENCDYMEAITPNFKVFTIPETIGGRFSVFTNVGLIPLAFAGIDIDQFLKGIKDIRPSIFSEDLNQNIALHLAIMQYQAYYEEGKNITVLFSYGNRFFGIGEWYKQLICESLGKNGRGMMLTNSIGISDQHSQLQLYQDGPDDKFYIFLESEFIKRDYRVCKDMDLTFNEILTLDKAGTKKALESVGRPVCELSIKKLDEYNIAKLLYVLQMQVIYIGILADENVFNQPGVEASKEMTREKLKEKYGEINFVKKAFYEK